MSQFASNGRAIDDFKSYAAERAIHFDPLDGSSANAQLLSALDPLLDGKRIAYVGEPDHFIHEKYAYRIAMLRWLSSRGFGHIGEELGMSDCRRIARFIASGDESQLERVITYGYKGADRNDRDDTPIGILRASFQNAYPTAQLAAEQKRFAHALREISLQRQERGEAPLRFFGFDIDPPGGGYEDARALLEHAATDSTIGRILSELERVTGESIDDEITRLGTALDSIQSNMERLDELIGADDAGELWHAVACLRDSLAFRRDIYAPATYEALNPAMAARERVMQREVTRVMREAGADAKFALMSHNLHLCRDIGAVARSDSGAGPGGNLEPPLGTWLAARHPGQVFSCWMLIGQGRVCQPYPELSSDIRLRSGTLNANLAEVGECFALPVDGKDPRARLLSSESELRWDGIGGVRTRLSAQADVIFFIRNITPLLI